MKRKFALFAAVISVLTFAACGTGETEEVTTTLPVKVVEQTLQTTTTAITTTAPVVEEKVISEIEQTDIDLAKIENNFDDTIDLSLVNVNNTWASIRNMTLDKFLMQTRIQKYPWAAISNEKDELFFLGNGYGVLSDMNDPTTFNGTLLGIECYNIDKALAKSVEDTQLSMYTIKAVTSSAENTKEDFEISYYNGVKVGMSYKDIQIAFGEREPEETETSETEVTDIETEVFTEEPIETTAETEETESTETSEKKKKKSEPVETSAPKSEPENTETVTAVTSDDKITDITEEPAVTPIDDSSLADVLETETETTTTAKAPEPEKIPEILYYKNVSNTLIIYFDNEGIVTKIYLYNNFT